MLLTSGDSGHLATHHRRKNDYGSTPRLYIFRFIWQEEDRREAHSHVLLLCNYALKITTQRLDHSSSQHQCSPDSIGSLWSGQCLIGGNKIPCPSHRYPIGMLLSHTCIRFTDGRLCITPPSTYPRLPPAIKNNAQSLPAQARRSRRERPGIC